MKNLIFLRHAKSDWGNEQLRDIDRHLNERGYADAYFMSGWFAKNKPRPQQIVSSTASRAYSTAQIFARSLELRDTGFRLERKIYESSVATLCSVIAQLDETLNCVMLVGHNPGFTDLCNELGDLHFDNIPTCGLVSIQFRSASWKKVAGDKGKTEYYHFPKDLRQQT